MNDGLVAPRLMTLKGSRRVPPDVGGLAVSEQAEPVANPLTEEVPSAADRVFRRWEDLRAFRKYWSSVTRQAKIVDLHFHNLRHTFATRLQRHGVDYELRQALLGHKMVGTTADYSQGGPEWDAKLRVAVNRLEQAYTPHAKRVALMNA